MLFYVININDVVGYRGRDNVITLTVNNWNAVPEENPRLIPGSYNFDSSISPDGKSYVHIFWKVGIHSLNTTSQFHYSDFVNKTLFLLMKIIDISDL